MKIRTSYTSGASEALRHQYRAVSSIKNSPRRFSIMQQLFGCALLTLVTSGAHAACLVDPSAWVIDSELACDNNFGLDIQIGSDARVINSSFEFGTSIGESSQVLASQLSNVQLGAGAYVVGASLGALELPVALGDGSIVEQGASVIAAEVGSNARIKRGARLNGGRGIDQIFIGNNLQLGNEAELRIRTLGDNAVIGARATIGESTNAGDNFRFGTNSVWVVGGSIGNGVTIGNNVNIDGGVIMGDGVFIGANSQLGFTVEIAAHAKIFNRTSLGNMSTVGANALLGRHVEIGNGATIGEGVIVGNRVNVGDNASIGAGSIIAARAVIPVGTVIPPYSLVNRDGSITPKP